MRKFKKFLAVAMAATMVFSMAACGGKEEGGKEEGGKQESKPVTLVYAEVNPLDSIVGQTATAALLADGQHVAAALPQHRFDAGAELRQQLLRHIGLHRSGKAAAVDTVGTATRQQCIAQRQGQRHRLLFHRAGGGDVLQIHPRAAAGLLHQV